ncbi:hypothetical protein [Sphingobium yanoikuyae]|uniref:hypothetical protein n=1 Tax=Sphingobium yanoikuyae TaxID=13690 RepID=UPI0022DDD5B3|nr:hypothetical protein [Sphingobium yanoikuyae]WBQ19300.1 hypothetical protein PAE53_23180 [Sphingobium yanoikuyae]
MEDHLKAAALAADMSDAELIKAWSAIGDRDDLTKDQQAVMDEMILRGLRDEA